MMTLSIMLECYYTVSFMLTVVYAEFCKLAFYADCHFAVILLNVIVLSVIMFNVVAPFNLALTTLPLITVIFGQAQAIQSISNRIDTNNDQIPNF
jgi:hypothetical protein